MNTQYEQTLEEVSDGTVNYNIVQTIHADRFFTYLKNDPLKRILTIEQVCILLGEEGWKTFEQIGTSYDYNAMVQYYGFDKMCDDGQIDEVWVWTFPYGGMWESHMMGEGAFWINSEPAANPSCKELLNIMGLNYERNLACALESYSHRIESTMMQVYGWWNYDSKSRREELTTWEKFAGYAKIYDRFDSGKSHVGNVHYPPNGQDDYNWNNHRRVLSYADEWYDYPNIKEKRCRLIDCSEWNCDHTQYMRWWLQHLPHYEGINPSDGKLNDWWYYVVDYNAALIEEGNLN